MVKLKICCGITTPHTCDMTVVVCLFLHFTFYKLFVCFLAVVATFYTMLFLQSVVSLYESILFHMPTTLSITMWRLQEEKRRCLKSVSLVPLSFGQLLKLFLVNDVVFFFFSKLVAHNIGT